MRHGRLRGGIALEHGLSALWLLVLQGLLILLFLRELRLVFAAERVELSLPDPLDLRLVDLLLLGDVVSMCGLGSALSLSCILLE